LIALEARNVRLPESGPPTSHRRLRTDGRFDRWWQILVAGLGLVLLLPVSAVIALLIKVTSRGPILYRGQRIGREMRPFAIFKFRTLLVDAEQRIGARLLTPGDPLYTPIGRLLKRTKLDEIPQLMSVVRGDMNLVGPRPIRPIFLATSLKEIDSYGLRFVVRPGMTGLAQLRGGYFTHPRDKLRYDLLYIANRSMWLDVKLVLATFVKLLNRWLTLGVLLLLMFLSVSFAPLLFQRPFELAIGAFRVSPFEMIGLLLAAVVLLRQIPAHRLYLYRTPTNRPMLGFLAISLLAGVFVGDLWPRINDAAYFTATGFLLLFLVVSGDVDKTFARRAARVVALVAVAVASLGIVQTVLSSQAVGAAGSGLPRVASTLGSPVVLSAYLVLGVPLVFVELWAARGREERDFWLICTTLVLVGVLLTQTRTSLLALWVTGGLFTWRVSARLFRLVLGAALAFLALLVATGTLRFSPADLASEWERRVEVTAAAISTELATPRALIGRLPGKGAESTVDVSDDDAAPGARPHVVRNQNMHLTLIQRTGLLGWATMMWVIGAALAAIYRGSRTVDDERLSLMLWAIFSSGIGFLLSMSNFNAFYNPTIQVTFWGLLGIGLGLATHLGERRPTFNVIYRFGQGE
jgi:lipopolysaccharide/colanic/teichoic acid biosynthesis glycosyltransferase